MALGLLELASIAVGIHVGDAMVKRSPVDEIISGTVHPGKYLVLVDGDVASVVEAMEAGREVSSTSLLDEIFLADPHPGVQKAVRGERQTEGAEAVGIVELKTAASLLGAADRALKGAEVVLREMHLADALGGKSYCLFQGIVSDVEAAVEIAVDGLRDPSLLVEQVVIPQLHADMSNNISHAAGFAANLQSRSTLGGRSA